MLKLSFIVPLYNTERFIIECLDSLYNQLLDASEFEVIVVNDGSTDSGPARVEHFATTRTNCRMISQQNGGLSAARNSGLRAAQGEFVMFVDSDDYLLPDTIRPFLDKLMANNLDLIRGKKINVDYDGKFLLSDSTRKHSGEVVDGGLLCTEILNNEYYVCQYLLRRSFLEQQELFFAEDIRLCEDVLFSIQVCNCATRTMYLAHTVYAYRRNNPGSILATAVNKRKLLDYIRVLSNIQHLKNERIGVAVDRAVARGVCLILSWASSLPASERQDIRVALNAPDFRWLCLSGISMRFKVQGLIYNLFSARGFLFFKGLSDSIRSPRK